MRIIRMMVLVFVITVISSCDHPEPKVRDIIRVSIRESALAPGSGVLIINNMTENGHDISLNVLNNVSLQQRGYKVQLGPYGKTEVGLLECNWKFEPNETVYIGCDEEDISVNYVLEPLVYAIFKSDSGKIGIREIRVREDFYRRYKKEARIRRNDLKKIRKKNLKSTRP